MRSSAKNLADAKIPAVTIVCFQWVVMAAGLPISNGNADAHLDHVRARAALRRSRSLAAIRRPRCLAEGLFGHGVAAMHQLPHGDELSTAGRRSAPSCRERDPRSARQGRRRVELFELPSIDERG